MRRDSSFHNKRNHATQPGALFAIAPVFCLLVLAATAAPQSQIANDRTVTAVLRKCLVCHSGRSPAGSLDLSSQVAALRGGKSGTALVPGKADSSRVYMLASTRKMPPDSALAESEIAALKSWIDSGAAWPATDPHFSVAARAGLDWWALQPVRRPIVTAAQRGAWVRNPIDALVLEELTKHGLRPEPPADRRTLIRRVTFDLLGVPPTPREVADFVADASHTAYENLVDRLLADPRYGERWGRHWLDVVRFGESQGFERDIIRDNAWRYRDYVVRSFNDDKPYNQFVREQIAGDVLQPVTEGGIVATGFLVCGPWDEVGHTLGSDVMRRRVREEEMEDVVSAVSQTFLGLTANCARCHDHKFDPITQKDYYRLKCALDGVQAGDRSCLSAADQHQRDATVADLKAKQMAAEARLAEAETRIRQRLMASPAAARPRPAGLVAPAAQWTFECGEADSTNGYRVELRGGARIQGGRLHLSGGGAYATATLPFSLREKTLEAWVALANTSQSGGGVLSVQAPGGTRFDAIVFGEREPGKWSAGSEFFHRSIDLAGPAESAMPAGLMHIAITYRADGRIALYRNGKPYGESYVPAGIDSGLQQFAAGSAQVLFGLRHEGAVNGYLAGDIEEARIYDSALTPQQVAASFAAGVQTIPASEIERTATSDERAEIASARQQIADVRKAVEALGQPPAAYAVNPKQPGPTAILLRGDSESRGETVSAGGLSCVRSPNGDFGLGSDAPESERRLRLANWIADRWNPLTARVMVNRIWHYHFGTGIVATPSDFGFNGDRPSHSKLLDWLASVFVDGGWRIKPIQRMILLSSTYRQSAAWNPTAAHTDADDRLLWRFPPQRLEGEAVRDSMLCVSGRINWKRGGPGFRPFTVEVNNSHFYKLVDRDEPEYNRRTVYRTIVNSARSPFLDALDCPDPSTKIPRRSVTTTATQALEMMNEEFVLRQARYLADRLKKEAGPEPEAQIRLAYLLAFGRPPTTAESDRAIAVVKRASLQTLAWALLNSSEFVYVR